MGQREGIVIKTITPGDVVVLEGGLYCKIEYSVGYRYLGTIVSTGAQVFVQWAYYHVEIAA